MSVLFALAVIVLVVANVLYLSGRNPITHSICPECTSKLHAELDLG